MMKFKPNQTRTYDREGYKKRAACLCFRSEREDEVLLVSSSRYPDQWIVPGGGMEPEEEPGGAAVREVYEELYYLCFSWHALKTLSFVVEAWELDVNVGCLKFPCLLVSE
uniref:Nudix hydrolase 4 n=1 Tax=Gallus gallus TaxID=9031 RepID=A0A8V0YSP6_CHICK